jgi:hypothetical protein
MSIILQMWEEHSEILALTFPSLPSLVHLNQDDRDSSELLDSYMEDLLETFIINEGHFDPRDILLLRNCKRDLACLIRKLDGVVDANGYFVQLLLLSREVLRYADCNEAYLIVTHDAELEQGPNCSVAYL